MEADRSKTKQLLKKSILGELSSDDTILLDALLQHLPETIQQTLFEEVCAEIAQSPATPLESPFSAIEKEQLLHRVLHDASHLSPGKKSNRIYQIRRFLPYIAACLLLVLAAGAWLIQQKVDPDKGAIKQAAVSSPVDIQPGQEKAILQTEDGLKIALDAIAIGEESISTDFKIVRLETGELKYLPNAQHSKGKTHRISTPKGGMVSFILPDGSKVWLNAASSLTFNLDMQESDRIVQVDGEVYFEVAKRNNQQFIVRSSYGEIAVLGTKFNVNTYNRKQTTVALLEGSIQLKTDHSERRIKPTEFVSVTATGNIKVEKYHNISDIILWKDGMFHFADADAYEIAEQLERWYNIEVAVRGKLSNHAINGKISRQVELSKMMDMLAYLGLQCSFNNNKLTINVKK